MTIEKSSRNLADHLSPEEFIVETSTPVLSEELRNQFSQGLLRGPEPPKLSIFAESEAPLTPNVNSLTPELPGPQLIDAESKNSPLQSRRSFLRAFNIKVKPIKLRKILRS